MFTGTGLVFVMFVAFFYLVLSERRFPAVATALCLSFALLIPTTVTNASSNGTKDLQHLLNSRSATADFGQLKLAIDKMFDPSMDAAAVNKQLNTMVTAVRTMAGPNASSLHMVKTLRRFIYKAGSWNNYRPFTYDHDNPNGLVLKNRLIGTYLKTRKGNCISMPLLFLILGERLGLKVTVAVAPLHVLVKFTDDASGQMYNLEATSGAGFTRDMWYRRQLPITDEAVQNGIYLRPLSRREVVSLMATVLMEKAMKERRYWDAIRVSNTILNRFPKLAYALVKRGTAYGYLMRDRFFKKYRNPKDIPVDQRPLLKAWYRENQVAFSQAEALGWKPTTQ